MKNMLRNFDVLIVLFITFIATALLKHVPLSQLIGVSSLIVIAGSVLAVGFVLGFENVLLAFLGRGPEAAEALIRGMILSSCLWATICFASVFMNLDSPDRIGPGVAGAFVSFMYGLFFSGYLAIANRVSKISNQFLFYAGAVVFMNASLTMAVLYVVGRIN